MSIIQRRSLMAASSKRFLYDLGDECSAITGGWASQNFTAGVNRITTTKESSYLSIVMGNVTGNTTYKKKGFATASTINAAGFSRIVCELGAMTLASANTYAVLAAATSLTDGATGSLALASAIGTNSLAGYAVYPEGQRLVIPITSDAGFEACYIAVYAGIYGGVTFGSIVPEIKAKAIYLE